MVQHKEAPYPTTSQESGVSTVRQREIAVSTSVAQEKSQGLPVERELRGGKRDLKSDPKQVAQSIVNVKKVTRSNSVDKKKNPPETSDSPSDPASSKTKPIKA